MGRRFFIRRRAAAAAMAVIAGVAATSGSAAITTLASAQATSSSLPPTSGGSNGVGNNRFDSRCPSDFDYNSCPSIAFNKGVIPSVASFDSSSCNKGGDCPTCLTGGDWETQLRSLGLGRADRTGVRPWVLFRNWLSHEVTSTIAMLLLRDAFGFDAYGRIGTTSNVGNADFICCGDEELMVDFERRGDGSTAAGTKLDEEGYFTVQMLGTGYTSTSDIYMPAYVLDRHPMASAYNAYKYLPDYANIFPKALSTNCSDMLIDRSADKIARCGDSFTRYVCSLNKWSDTSCFGGHYVPPQCEGDDKKQYCQEIYHPSPLVDEGRFEGIVKNNNLNFTIAYLGEAHFSEFLMAKYARRENFLFVGSLPSALTSTVAGRPLNLDPYSSACGELLNTDPTLNEAACAYPDTTVQKAARRDVLREQPDIKFLIDKFTFTDEDIAALLVKHRTGAGNMSTYALSCDWLKANFNVWSTWVQHTAPDEPVFVPSSSGVAAWVIAVPVVLGVVCLIIAVTGVFFGTRKSGVDNTHAPKTAPLALLFTDIDRGATLWELCGEDMKVAMETHHTIVRRLIAEYQAYEVKTNGDSFMIACKTLTDAALLSLAMQTALNEASYPPSINETYAQLQGVSVNTPRTLGRSYNNNKSSASEHRRSGSRANSHISGALVIDSIIESKSGRGADSDADEAAFSVTSHHADKSNNNNNGNSNKYRSGATGAGNAFDQLNNNGRSVAPSTVHSLTAVSKPSGSLQGQGGDSPSSHPSWNGLRLRVGLHWCNEVTPKVDPMTGRYDFFGHDVNVCARVQSYAVGGQILVEESTHLHMTRNDDLMELLGADCILTCVARGAVLKGVADKVALWSLVPSTLSARRFAPISGVDLPDGQAAGAEGGGAGGRNRSRSNTDVANSASSSNGKSNNTANPMILEAVAAVRYGFQFTMGGFATEEDRTAWINALAKKHKLSNRLNMGRLQRLLQTTAIGMFMAQNGFAVPAGGAGASGGGGGPRNESHSGAPSSQDPSMYSMLDHVQALEGDDKMIHM